MRRKQSLQQIIDRLKSGGIGVFPTDTLYGLVGSALNQKTVGRIYKVRQRTPSKPLIVLISSLEDLRLFGIKPDRETRKILNQYWPGKVSIILPTLSNKLIYLHRRTKTIAFRLPAKADLRRILKKTGPLVAPSANPEGQPPAKSIKESKAYFDDRVDFYLAGKRQTNLPSTLIKITNGQVKILRPGARLLRGTSQ